MPTPPAHLRTAEHGHVARQHLLDQENDHGVKAAHDTAGGAVRLFERPNAKVVVFSQWVRMHELVVRRVQARGWGHVFFHGGVPAEPQSNTRR